MVIKCNGLLLVVLGTPFLYLLVWGREIVQPKYSEILDYVMGGYVGNNSVCGVLLVKDLRLINACGFCFVATTLLV